MNFVQVTAPLVFGVIVATANAPAAFGQEPSEVDQAASWERHVIGANVKRADGLSMEVGDLNDDGQIDALIAFGERNIPRPTDGVYWFESPRDVRSGNWRLRRLTAPSLPIHWCLAVSAEDMDNDGDLDVVALSFDDAIVYLAINPLNQHGDIHQPWQTIKILESSQGSRDGERVELIDIDRDGFRDVVFPRGGPAEVHILFNPLGDLTDKWHHKIVGEHGGSDAHGILCADIDLDGDTDIVAASGDLADLGKVYWYEHPDGNPRHDKWLRHQVSRTEVNYGALQIDDVDGDGRPDILVTEAHRTPGKAMWFKNPKLPQGHWKRFIIGTQTYPHESLSLDVDGDGNKEYWVGDSSYEESGQFGPRNGGVVYFSMTDNPKDLWQKNRVAAAPEVGRQCRAVDLDKDGDLDVVSTADHFQKKHTISVVWWENKLSHSPESTGRSPTDRSTE